MNGLGRAFPVCGLLPSTDFKLATHRFVQLQKSAQRTATRRGQTIAVAPPGLSPTHDHVAYTRQPGIARSEARNVVTRAETP